MKINHFIFLSMLLPQGVWASVCEDAWRTAPKKSQTQILCRLEWTGQGGAPLGIEWVKIEKGCSMEGDSWSTCFVVRECDSRAKINGAIGEGVMLTPNKPQSFCLGSTKNPTSHEKRLPLFNRDRKDGSASLVCSELNQPIGVVLQGPTQEKRCGVDVFLQSAKAKTDIKSTP